MTKKPHWYHPSKQLKKMTHFVNKVFSKVEHSHDHLDSLALHFFHQESYIARNIMIMDPIDRTLRWRGIYDKG